MTTTVVPAIALTWLFDFDPDGGGGVVAAQYAFGINTTTRSFWFHSGVGPLEWMEIGSGAPGPTPGVDIFKDGVDIGGNPHLVLNFTGSGVTATNAGGGVANIAIPGPAPSLTQVFRYVVTGLEPDPSQIAIVLPVAMPDASYEVSPSCQGVTNIAAFDVVGITNVGFTLIASGDLQVGDVISFVATRLT